MESLTGVKKVDLWVRPDPGTLLIGLIMPYGQAQDLDVLKEPPVGAFEQIQDKKNCFSTPRLSAYRCRMGRLRQCHRPVPQYPVIQDRKAGFVLVVDHSGQLWQSDHVVLERYTSDVV